MSIANGRAGPMISRAGSGLPSRIIFHGVEGIGKTSLGAYTIRPIFAMTRGETGLLSLIDNGLVPETDHFDESKTWTDLLIALNYLIVETRENKTFVLDTLNGAERLCFEHICSQKYGGNWESFQAYGRGPEVAMQEWVNFLALLDRLREARRMAVVLLCHTKIKTFKNPEGDDYDRYAPDLHDKIWGLTAKWADIILFGNFETFAKKEKGALRAKGVGGNNRIMYTQRTAAWDAKNRSGLPTEIPMGTTGDECWANLFGALRNGRKTAAKESAPANNHTHTTEKAEVLS